MSPRVPATVGGRLGALAVALVLLAGRGLAQPNLIINGDFEGGSVPDGNCDPVGDDQLPNGWSCLETFSGGGPEVSLITLAPDNGPSRPGANAAHFSRVDLCHLSGDWTTIEQAISADVSACRSVTFNLDVKLVPLSPPASHNLGGSGHMAGLCDPSGYEYPVTAVIFYTDITGAPHCWQYGWYQYTTTQANRTDPGCVSGFDGQDANPDPAVSQQIPVGAWVHSSFDLLSKLPNVKSIDRIRVGGSGWSFDGAVDNLWITCVPVPVPAVSHIGLVAAVLLLLALGSWKLWRWTRAARMPGGA